MMNGPFDVDDDGRMAVIKDPTGAVFALWQAKDNKGAGFTTCPTLWSGTSSAQHDTAESRRVLFKRVWLDQRTVSVKVPIEYTVFKNGDEGVGGMYKIMPEMGPIPPHWLVYFAVDDCDAKVQKATELGAR